MSIMLLLLVTLFCLAAVKVQTIPCCVENQWSATMYDVRALAQGNSITADFYYDYINRITAIQYYQYGSRVKTNKVVTFYGKGYSYTVSPESCVKMPTTDQILPNCIRNDSTHLGSSYVGTETSGLKSDTWFFASGALNFTVSYTYPGCILTFQGKVDTIPSPPVDTVVYFNGYKKGINDPDAFGVPASCL